MARTAFTQMDYSLSIDGSMKLNLAPLGGGCGSSRPAQLNVLLFLQGRFGVGESCRMDVGYCRE